jgi:hypothetical protein
MIGIPEWAQLLCSSKRNRTSRERLQSIKSAGTVEAVLELNGTVS